MVVRLLSAFLNFLLIAGVIAVGLASGFVYGMYQKLSEDLPRLEQLVNYQPSELTTVYSRDGQVLDRFFLENRIVVPLNQIPQNLKNAFFAIEDSRFYEHQGIDMKGMARALVKNLKAGRIVEGASTITQQLVRTMFLTRKKVFGRKLREMLLAWKLEQLLTKDQILEMYFNEIYLGSGAYGVEAASRTYFGKSVQDLSLGECAILASLPKAPENYNPKASMEKARTRQKMVLDKMVSDGYISEVEAETAYHTPLELHQASPEKQAGLYFVEYVRQRLEQQLGSSAVHRGGLKIYTTLDLELQKQAELSLRDGLRKYDKRHGFRGPLTPEQPIIDLNNTIEVNSRLLARVREINAKQFEMDVLTTHSGKRPDSTPLADDVISTPGSIEVEWLKKNWSGKISDKLKPKDIVLVKVLQTEPLLLGLEQEPEIEGGILSLDPFTGEVLAMVGGYDFEKSKFNRAIQSKRQPGSAFKLFVYLAALQAGFTPASIVYDSPVVYNVSATPVPGAVQPTRTEGEPEEPKLWKPQNYYGKFFGKLLLKDALAKSLNPVTVKLIEEVGVDATIRTARRLGLTAELAPDLSLGLGSSGVSLLEMTAAYGAMASSGRYAHPYFVRRIEDRDGQILEERVPEILQTVSEPIAYIMTRMLKGVIEHGTATEAQVLHRPLAGKTGTTNDFRDAWFLGYSPQIATGVWVGYDNMQRSLGKSETGALTALPIWISFMQTALARFPDDDFVQPARVVHADIDSSSGLLATPQCSRVYRESFVEGTEPTKLCDQHSVSAANFEQMDSMSGGEEEGGP